MNYFRSTSFFLACLGLRNVAHAATVTGDVAAFDWHSINPSTELGYHPCYEGFQCARLLLPLDWLNGTDERTVIIAITKLPAVVDDNDATFAGTIFAQPGGPAVSGTNYVRNIGHKLQQLVDISEKKHYEILSFDLRGTGQTEPRVDCFPGILSYIRVMQNLVNGHLDLSHAALDLGIAAAKADGHQCEKIHGDFLPHISTASIARDMVAILDQVEALRQKATQAPQSTPRLDLRSEDVASPDVGDGARLQYWGISYGTFIGNTFASMFPGRVGRMVLDGVMDATDVVQGMGFLKNTLETDEIVLQFFQGCFLAGESRCALYRDTDHSAADISTRVWAWAQKLNQNPLTIITEDGSRLYIRQGEIQDIFLWAMYSAISESQPLARDLHQAMHGNATSLLGRMREFYMFDVLPEAGFSNYTVDAIIPDDARSAIVCADGEDVTHLDNLAWNEYLQTQLSLSSLAGAMWTTVRLECAGWKVRPKWSFKGPFGTPKPSEQQEALRPGRPAAPLLFASNRYDPVTPLRNARTMAESHPGAAVLVQNTTGHCLLLGSLGSCARDVVSAYFDTGVVPDEETWSCSDTALCISLLGQSSPDHLAASPIMEPASLMMKLPVELLRSILSFVPDVESLRNTILSSSWLYDAFVHSETTITTKVLLQQIHDDVLPEAIKRLESASLPGSASESITFLQQLGERDSNAAPESDPKIWSLREALHIARFHSVVTNLTREFIVHATSHGPPCLFDTEISDSELYRIQRALYRFEIYRNAFPLTEGEQLPELENHWQLFFSNFAPWENEQLGCIHDFLVWLVLPGFSDVAEHDVAWGVAHIDYDTFDSPWIQYFFSLGLEKLARIGSAKTYEDRYRVLGADKRPDLTFDFLLERFQEANRDYDSAALDYPYGIVTFFHERDPGPEDAWRWAHPEEHSFYWVYQPNRDILRKWAYVMWDRARLDHVGLFAESFEDMDAKRDHESEQHEVTRQQGYMSNSWEQREKVSSRGGKGWWSWGDESKLIWSDKSTGRTGMPFRRQSFSKDTVTPHSLHEARAFLESMTLPLSSRR